MLDIYKTTKALHSAMYRRCQAITEALPSKGTTKRLTDLVYVIDQAISYLEDIVKELKKLRDDASKRACAMQVTMLTGEPLEGVYATGQAKYRTAGKEPSRSKDPEGYARLCELLGVENHPLTGIHFTAFREYLTAFAERGENIPAELEQYVKYKDVQFIVKGRDDNQIDLDSANEPFLIG